MIWFAVWLLLAKPVGYVNDFAGIISPAVEAELEEDLANYTASSSNELAVVTLTSLEGDTIENTAVALFEQWSIGQKNKDNGVLLLIALNERELKIEVGYGLEPALTDSRAGTIIRDVITPNFKQDDYDGGITDGVGAIIAVLAGESLPQPVTSGNGGDGIWIVLLIFLLVFIFIWLGRRQQKHSRLTTGKSSWGGLPAGRQGFSSGKSSGGSFGGFSGGRSGGGGASGKW